jgi:N-terminal domain of anti-restriction factor ArdC
MALGGGREMPALGLDPHLPLTRRNHAKPLDFLTQTCFTVHMPTALATKTTDRAEKLDAALATLSAGVSAIRSSDDWKNVLAVSAKFPKYSFRNIMMIFMQRPDATMVAGFNTWKKLGRSVMKGEKGIQIFAPVIVKRENEKTGKEETKLVGFRIVHTFDISQTEGKELPVLSKAISLEGDAPEMLLENIFDFVRSHDFTPSLVARKNAAHGWTNFNDSEVAVVDDLSPLHRVKTALHETGHMLAHNPADHDGVIPFTSSVREVEAESVAYLVANVLGLDTSEYSFDYVAGWADDEKAVLRMADRILGFAKTILAALDVAEVSAEEEVPA